MNHPKSIYNRASPKPSICPLNRLKQAPSNSEEVNDRIDYTDHQYSYYNLPPNQYASPYDISNSPQPAYNERKPSETSQFHKQTNISVSDIIIPVFL